MSLWDFKMVQTPVKPYFINEANDFQLPLGFKKENPYSYDVNAIYHEV